MAHEELSSTLLPETNPSVTEPLELPNRNLTLRRSFLKGIGMAGAVASASVLLGSKSFADSDDDQITPGMLQSFAFWPPLKS